MKYTLDKNHKILCGLSVGTFAVWMITTVVLNFVLEDIGTAFLWAIGMDILWSAIALVLIVNPTPKIFSRNITTENEKAMTKLRRDMLCGILLAVNIGCFLMALCHNFGIVRFISKEEIEAGGFYLVKVGIINLIGVAMMVAIAGLGINYGVKSKQLLIAIQEAHERGESVDEAEKRIK